MTAAEIVTECRRAGLALRTVGDQIRVRPKSRLTPELAEAIRAHKAEVAELVTRAARPAVFEYILEGEPGPLVLICPPGSDLAHARRRLTHQFGPDQVIEVRRHNPTER